MIGTGNIAAMISVVSAVIAATGQLKVTRGGSHGTEMYYLRSANRQAAVPSERNWFIGFRVATQIGIENANSGNKLNSGLTNCILPI